MSSRSMKILFIFPRNHTINISQLADQGIYILQHLEYDYLSQIKI